MSASARRPASRRCWWATTRPRRSTSAASTAPATRSASRSIAHDLPADTAEDELLELVERAERTTPAVNGIIVQLPLPGHIDRRASRRRVDPRKDVDGLTPTNAGLLVQGRDGLVPATPVRRDGAAARLRHAARGSARRWSSGRSDLVGKPVASLLLAENATVTMCHSRTRDLAEVCRRADVLVAAVGRPRLVTGDMVKRRRDRDRRRHEPHRRRPRGRRRLRVGRRAGAGDHARARRGGADDDRDAAAQHVEGRAAGMQASVRSSVREHLEAAAWTWQAQRGELIAAVGGSAAADRAVLLRLVQRRRVRQRCRSADGQRRRATSGPGTARASSGTIANLVILAAALAAVGARDPDRDLSHGRAAGRGQRDHRRARDRGRRDGAAAHGVPARPERARRPASSGSCSR